MQAPKDRLLFTLACPQDKQISHNPLPLFLADSGLFTSDKIKLILANKSGNIMAPEGGCRFIKLPLPVQPDTQAIVGRSVIRRVITTANFTSALTTAMSTASMLTTIR